MTVRDRPPLRRTSWHLDFIHGLGGISRADEQLTVKFRSASGGLEFTSAALRVDGRITRPSPRSAAPTSSSTTRRWPPSTARHSVSW